MPTKTKNKPKARIARKRKLSGDSLQGLVRQFPKRPKIGDEVVLRPNNATVETVAELCKWADKKGWKWVMWSIWGGRFVYQPNTKLSEGE